MEKTQKERFQAILERIQGTRDRDRATFNKDKATLDRDTSINERAVEGRVEQTQKVREITSSRDQLKSNFERLQRRQQEVGSGKEGKARKPIEPLMARSILESKMEVDRVPMASGRFNLDRVAQEQTSDDLETWTPPEPTLSL